MFFPSTRDFEVQLKGSIAKHHRRRVGRLAEVAAAREHAPISCRPIESAHDIGAEAAPQRLLDCKNQQQLND